jgi:hypothetical protein
VQSAGEFTGSDSDGGKSTEVESEVEDFSDSLSAFFASSSSNVASGMGKGLAPKFKKALVEGGSQGPDSSGETHGTPL